MFSSQNNPSFYSGESTMTQYTGHWSYDQTQQVANQQCFQYLDSANSAVNYPQWSSLQGPTIAEHKHTFETNNYYHHADVPQRNAIQFTSLPPKTVPCPANNLPTPYQNNAVMSKKHRAKITFVPTNTGNFKAIVKRKRKRTYFTTEQIKALEDIFKTKRYITREDREVIVNQLQLNDKAVKIWFQNRRLKDKKVVEENETEDEGVQHLTRDSSPNAVRLDDVESKIHEKTNEFGYVTLDDGLMSDLFNVIDNVLTHKTPEMPVQEVTENSSSPIYEPISPAGISLSNDSENASNWQPAEPNESLQRLFDLQSMLLL